MAGFKVKPTRICCHDLQPCGPSSIPPWHSTPKLANARESGRSITSFVKANLNDSGNPSGSSNAPNQAAPSFRARNSDRSRILRVVRRFFAIARRTPRGRNIRLRNNVPPATNRSTTRSGPHQAMLTPRCLRCFTHLKTRSTN